MIEEIIKNFFRVEIPIPWSPLKAVNSYVIKSAQRNLIIDTGWNRVECMNVMKATLKKLKVDLRKTDFFITHFHADHLGLVWKLATETSNIYFNQPDSDWIKSVNNFNSLFSFGRMCGFPESELQVVIGTDSGYEFGSKGHLSFTILKEDETIGIGDYMFKCVETPGHTNGHMCLYEPNKKVLVTGDHILKDITPNIQLWSHKGNPLSKYLISLDKVYKLDVELLLPGHRGIFRNYRERIKELKCHHQERLNEILSILKKGETDAFQVASQMSWDIADKYGSWDQFPALQKWFATGEAIAHLKYLEEQGLVQKDLREQNIAFSLNVKHET